MNNSKDVKIVDRGWKKLVQIAKQMRGEGLMTLKVGIIGENADKEHISEDGKSTITMARLGGVHEYGAVIKVGKGRIVIPQRSFIRATIAEKNNYKDLVAKLFKQVISGQRDEKTALSLLGETIVGDIKMRIAEGIEPANSPRTIAAKGSSKPLVDTGQLRNSITYAVEE